MRIRRNSKGGLWLLLFVMFLTIVVYGYSHYANYREQAGYGYSYSDCERKDGKIERCPDLD